jgi:hypothetical protein
MAGRAADKDVTGFSRRYVSIRIASVASIVVLPQLDGRHDQNNAA